MTYRALLFAAVILLALPVAAAAAPPAALGDGGELYQALAGPYGTLFPEGVEHSADLPVLAIDVARPDGDSERLLVPASTGPETDGTPTLVFESSSDILWLVWEAKADPLVSAVRLAGLAAGPDGAGGAWSESIEISGDVAPLKGAPQVLVTRDDFIRPADNPAAPPALVERTVLHVVWWESGGSTGEAVYYSPVVLEAGSYLGWNPVLRLNELAPPIAGSTLGAIEPPPPALLRAPRLRTGRDIGAGMVGFVDPASRRLLVIELRPLPGELGRLADDLRAQIIDIGYRPGPDPVSAIADTLRAQIIDIGRRWNPGAVEHFADRAVAAARDLEATQPGLPITALADELRAQIIDIGAQLLVDLDRHASAGQVIEIAAPAAPAVGAKGTQAPPHLVRLRLAADRPSPRVEAGTSPRILLSEDGGEAVVAWREEGVVFYSEAGAPGETAWSEARRLPLSESLTDAEAEAVLETRIRKRQ